jgi:hypothetical protein
VLSQLLLSPFLSSVRSARIAASVDTSQMLALSMTDKRWRVSAIVRSRRLAA